MLLLFSLHLRRLVIIAEYRTKSEPTRQERLGDKLLPLTRPNEAHQSHGTMHSRPPWFYRTKHHAG